MVAHSVRDPRKEPTGGTEQFSAEDRSLRARAAAHLLHAAHDSVEVTEPARRAFRKSFEDRVDPDHVLSEEERHRRAQHALTAHMLQLARKSAQTRRRS